MKINSLNVMKDMLNSKNKLAVMEAQMESHFKGFSKAFLHRRIWK